MSDTDTSTPTPNGNGEFAGEGPQVAGLGQYIKDLSVENPSAPQVFQWEQTQPLDVQFNIKVNRIADDVHEVVLKITVTAASDKGTHYVVDLSYAGLFGVRGVPEDALGPFLLVEAPRLIFPFARQIVAEQVTNLGFPPLLLDPIDFGQVYLAQMQGEGEFGEAQPSPTDA
jgi:preprotein translocase subunit SecB